MLDTDFLSKEQKTVVLYRLKCGYEAVKRRNGYYLLFKGKHRMLIDACGYDQYVPVQ